MSSPPSLVDSVATKSAKSKTSKDDASLRALKALSCDLSAYWNDEPVTTRRESRRELFDPTSYSGIQDTPDAEVLASPPSSRRKKSMTKGHMVLKMLPSPEVTPAPRRTAANTKSSSKGRRAAVSKKDAYKTPGSVSRGNRKRKTRAPAQRASQSKRKTHTAKALSQSVKRSRTSRNANASLMAASKSLSAFVATHQPDEQEQEEDEEEEEEDGEQDETEGFVFAAASREPRWAYGDDTTLRRKSASVYQRDVFAPRGYRQRSSQPAVAGHINSKRVQQTFASKFPSLATSPLSTTYSSSSSLSYSSSSSSSSSALQCDLEYLRKHRAETGSLERHSSDDSIKRASSFATVVNSDILATRMQLERKERGQEVQEIQRANDVAAAIHFDALEQLAALCQDKL